MTALIKPPSRAPGPWDRLFPTCARVCVLHVGKSDEVAVYVLARCAELPATATAQLDDPSVLDLDTPAALAQLHDLHRALGWEPSELLPDGFYLFVGGQARAFEAGRRPADGAELLTAGALVIDIVQWMRGRKSRPLREDVDALQRATRVVESFKTHVRQHAPDLSLDLPIAPPSVDARRAFKVLGLNETANRAKVRARRREMMRRVHPALAISDLERGAFALQAAIIEGAVTTIHKARGWD